MTQANFMARTSLSQLIIVDLQTRLAAVMAEDDINAVIKNCGILVQAAAMLEVPTVITEQYPAGLGHTVPALLALLPEAKPVEKITFSCMSEPKFSSRLTHDHSQILLAGMEAHICVLQTAMALVAAGKQVFVVEDAIISRNPGNKSNALARMRDAGCIITNTESTVFEWLGRAQGDVFKAINKLIR